MSAPEVVASTEDERLARAALSAISEPGDPRILTLVAAHGARPVYRALLNGDDVHGTGTDYGARLHAVDPARDLERATRLGVRFVIPGDPEWPEQVDDLALVEPLQERGGAPVGLWVRGPLGLDQLSGSVAVVGSRAATSYGTSTAGDIAACLAAAGAPVVSGAAFGIDQAAHRGALGARGHTVAVLACGADRVYPEAHRALIGHLAEVGAVVSEAPLGAAPLRIRFLARNRLIAALARGTVVVEAAARSGALNTANWCNRLNRVAMGVPGPATAGSSAGVHHLIRSGAATLVTHGKDVLELVGDPGQHLLQEPRGPATSRDHLDIKQRQVLDAVPLGLGAPSGSIARVAGLGPKEVHAILARLADLALVEREESGWRLTERAQG